MCTLVTKRIDCRFAIYTHSLRTMAATLARSTCELAVVLLDCDISMSLIGHISTRMGSNEQVRTTMVVMRGQCHVACAEHQLAQLSRSSDCFSHLKRLQPSLLFISPTSYLTVSSYHFGNRHRQSSQMLAPFNNSMRLGQGFNSYTQQICLNHAVTIDPKVNLEKPVTRDENIPGQITQNTSDYGKFEKRVAPDQ